MTDTAADRPLLDRYVDWDFAASTARRVARPGPEVSAGEAGDVVAALRSAAGRARPHVARITGLTAMDPDPQVFVVDRPGWVTANLSSLRSVLEPVVDALASRRSFEPPALVTAVGGKVTGLETGGLLAFLSTKVLGQYDINAGGAPRLLLVAPNVVHTEREMDVDPADFRLWVCLHEETHRVQFTAVPWLRQHMIDQVHSLARELAPDPKALIGTMEEAARRLPGILRGEGGSLLDLFTTTEQRHRIAQLTAVMSLLEGHADVVMDEVGPDVVPTVRTIRERFTARRGGTDPLDRLIRRLLGLEDKMRQYRDGAVFVRGVVAEVGMDGFNQVWTSPETLPSPAEIVDPRAWVRRVHG